MEKQSRHAISNVAQSLRRLLEDEYTAQLDGIYDIRSSGLVATEPGEHLTPERIVTRGKIVAAVEYHRAAGLSASEAVDRFVRDAAFTTLNRFVALKMLEGRELIQEAVSGGENSVGYREYTGLAPGVATLGDGEGYRLYLESLFDELASEIKVLFDRQDAASLLWPRRNAFEAMLAELNNSDLDTVWEDDETIGWFYQFFNSKEERQQMRDESQAPRNSRELAVRNQFFTPRYVVQFLVDNTLGRIWIEMTGGDTRLAEKCEYFVTLEEQRRPRPFQDPRDFKILDPACGSGHFLLYCFDLLDVMYHEAWERGLRVDEATEPTLRDNYETIEELERAIPVFIVERNLHGIDIDPRAAQIAALAIWLRAQRSWRDAGISADQCPQIRRTGVVIAEPMPGDSDLVDEFAARLEPPVLGSLFHRIVLSMQLAGEMGPLLHAEAELADAITQSREEFVALRLRPPLLPGFSETSEEGQLDLTGIDDDSFFADAEQRLVDALHEYAVAGAGAQSAPHRMFAEDAGAGVALLELLRQRYDVVLMNPPFGQATPLSRPILEKEYPLSKNDLLASFVERGVDVLVPGGFLGAITSRTCLFLKTFAPWRQDSLLDSSRLMVVADLGRGVLDAEVESAAYVCMRPST